MTAQKIRKIEHKDIEPFRASSLFTPFERVEEMFDDILRRPFTRAMWPAMPRMFENIETSPLVDIYEEGGSIVVKSDIPGVDKEDLEINLADDSITLSGERKGEEKIENKEYYCHERTYGSFKRTFGLPAEVQTSKAKASFKDGVLEVRIPKTEAAKKKGHKIKIE